MPLITWAALRGAMSSYQRLFRMMVLVTPDGTREVLIASCRPPVPEVR